MQSPREFTNPAPRRLALLLIAIGALFALDRLLNLYIVYELWPVLIAMIGAGLIGIFVRGNSRMPMFLVAGVYLLCFSGLALFCNFTSWATMANLWPLFVTFLGVVFVALFVFEKKRRAYLLAGLLLMSLSVVFSVTMAFGARLWWMVFILAGLSILVAEKFK